MATKAKVQLFDVSFDGTTLTWTDKSDRKTVLTAKLAEIHKDRVQDVLAYGYKQIVMDGGALSEGATKADRIAAMRKRAASVIDGSWGTRRSAPLTAESAVAFLKASGLTAESIAKMMGAAK